MSDLPKGWVEATLGDLSAKPQYGWTTKAVNNGQGLKLLRTTDITKGPVNWGSVPYCTAEPPDPNKYRLKDSDIVVSRAGSVGASALVRRPEPAVFASYLIRLRLRETVSARYVSYYLQSPRYWEQVRRAAAGIALQNLNARKLAEILVPVAPLAEQQRIVAAIEEQFSRLDAAEVSLATSLRRIRKLHDAVQSVVLVGDWPVVPLADIGGIITGSTPRTGTASNWGPGVPFVTPGDLNHGKRVGSSSRTLTRQGLGQTRRIAPNSVLVTCIGATIGKASLVTTECATNQQINAVVPDPDRVDPSYLLQVLASRPLQEDIRYQASNTTMPILNKSRFGRVSVPLPPLLEQRRIVAEVERQISVIDVMSAAIDRAFRGTQVLRRSILDRAFTGRLVPQDPNDEPASVLLQRIAASQDAGRATRSKSRTAARTSPR